MSQDYHNLGTMTISGRVMVDRGDIVRMLYKEISNISGDSSEEKFLRLYFGRLAQRFEGLKG